MSNLFLDDIREPIQAFSYTNNRVYYALDWDVVKNYDEFVDYIQTKGLPEIVSFDHDISEEHYTPYRFWHDYEASKEWQDSQNYKEKTGLDCAKFLTNFCLENNLELPLFYCHSQNPVGKDRILNLLNNFLKKSK